MDLIALVMDNDTFTRLLELAKSGRVGHTVRHGFECLPRLLVFFLLIGILFNLFSLFVLFFFLLHLVFIFFFFLCSNFLLRGLTLLGLARLLDNGGHEVTHLKELDHVVNLAEENNAVTKFIKGRDLEINQRKVWKFIREGGSVGDDLLPVDLSEIDGPSGDDLMLRAGDLCREDRKESIGEAISI